MLTEFRLTDPHHQASPYYSDHYFPQQSPEALVKSAKEKKDEAFISSYKFQDKRLGIYKKYLDSTKLSPSKERNLIIEDLMLQMERASSNVNQFWLDPSKIMTSTTKIYPSPTDIVPIWQQEIGKFLESEIPNNSESSIKPDSAAKIGVSSDNREKNYKQPYKRFSITRRRGIYANIL